MQVQKSVKTSNNGDSTALTSQLFVEILVADLAKSSDLGAVQTCGKLRGKRAQAHGLRLARIHEPFHPGMLTRAKLKSESYDMHIACM